MATRSMVGIKTETGIRAIYVHWDGYPEGVGKTLNTYYNSDALINEMMDLGNASSIGPELGTKHDFNRPSSSGMGKECTFYGRDRGEDGQESINFESTQELVDYAKGSWLEWIYIKGPDGWMTKPMNGEWQSLEEVLNDTVE